MSTHLGVDIEYNSPSLLNFFLEKRKQKLPGMLILVMIMLHYLPRFQREPETAEWVERLLNRPARIFEQFIKNNMDLLSE